MTEPKRYSEPVMPGYEEDALAIENRALKAEVERLRAWANDARHNLRSYEKALNEADSQIAALKAELEPLRSQLAEAQG